MTEKQKKQRRAAIARLVKRRAKRLAEPNLPDEVADPTVEVVTPDAELDALPDGD